MSAYSDGLDAICGLDVLGSAAPDMVAVRAGQAALRLGMSGPAVSYVQWKLGISATGIYDAVTKKAVESFQLNNFLRVDGEVGKDTAAALDKLAQPLSSGHGIPAASGSYASMAPAAPPPVERAVYVPGSPSTAPSPSSGSPPIVYTQSVVSPVDIAASVARTFTGVAPWKIGVGALGAVALVALAWKLVTK